MTCHHRPGDPNCSSHPDHPDNPANVRLREIESRTPDADRFEVEDVVAVGSHLVMKVKYPNCERCSYEGTKIMVFLNCSTIDALKWRRLDPHFRPYNQNRNPREAPGPDARFPGSKDGWRDAINYAKSKTCEGHGIR